jgi:ADP-ribosyl-[dinitrogen reductase] hydrolase
MMRLLVMGSDVDTVCAIYGQIAGACYGYEAIPERWISALQKRELLTEVLDGLIDSSLKQI